MELVLDLGNTNQKIGVFNGEHLVHLSRHEKLNMSLLKDLFGEFPGLTHGIVSSVVQFPSGYRNFLKNHLKTFLELTHRTPVPVLNDYQTPVQLGKDRLASAVAAAELFEGCPAMVINAGTCITYDLVTSDKRYCGGAISPGLRMRLQALHTFTGKLPLLELQETDFLVGDTTQRSIMAGVVNGTVAEIKGMIIRYKKQYPSLCVLLSGGDMEYLEKRLKIRIFAFPNIVLIGLKYILEFNLHHDS